MNKLILILIFFTKISFASFEINENIERSYSCILNLEFEKAKGILYKEQLQNPKNGFIPLHENYIDFLTIIISEDVRYFHSHEYLKNIRLAFLDECDRDSPYYLYSKAEVNLQWAFSRLKFEQYATAAYELVKAYRLLEENRVKFPEFTLNNKGLGLIHALLGAVPKKFHWILNIAGLHGSFSVGISELDEVLDDSRFAGYEKEVLFLLSFLQINLGNNDTLCQKYLDRIGNRYEDNLLLNFAAAQLSHNLGYNDYCLRVLESKPNNISKLQFYYLDYLHAMAYLYELDFINAQQKFDYFLKNFRGLNYIKSANHKLAWIAFLQNNFEMKTTYFERVISDGNSFIDEDRVALRDAERNYISHFILLKARLLYDGGYYSLALAELNQIKGDYNFFFGANEVEYWYRLARVKSKLINNEKVLIQSYITALEKGKDAASYYASMSALQIGFIYEKNNNFQQAKLFFKKCLSMSGFDYQRGIHQKATAGLSRVAH